jgi:hypothetical protein
MDRLDYEIGILQKKLTKSQLEFLDLKIEEMYKKKKISEKNMKKLEKKEERRKRNFRNV